VNCECIHTAHFILGGCGRLHNLV